VALVSVLQLTVVGAPTAAFVQFLLGSVLAMVGMALLFIGVDLGILPMGKFIGAELPTRGSLGLIVAVTFALGFATTVAEPDVLVLAAQVSRLSTAVSELGMLYVVGLGVAAFAALASARIVWGVRMTHVLFGAYGLMLALSFFAPPEFVPIAYDAGSVTTGVLTAPVVIALALGLSAVLAGRSAVSDGFGVLGLASVGPVIAILLMGIVRG
jgi:hypothetical protein